jgi:hypothetical protein
MMTTSDDLSRNSTAANLIHVTGARARCAKPDEACEVGAGTNEGTRVSRNIQAKYNPDSPR